MTPGNVAGVTEWLQAGMAAQLYALFVAQELDAGPVINLVQFGVLGVFVILFIVRKIVSGIEVERMEKRLQAKEELVESLYNSIKDEVVPALTSNTIALGRATELITEMSIKLAVRQRKTT